MKTAFCCIAFFLWAGKAISQAEAESIGRHEAEEILSYLASDSLKGRGNGSPELKKAAHFIADYFKKAGLNYLANLSSHFHPFIVDDAASSKHGKKTEATDTLFNVIGVLPGRSKAHELVILSAHYDHLGIEKKKIYNGANDNASGTTALLLLARYFGLRRDNERTIIFCAFSGEEWGLLGSSAFLPRLKQDSIVAVLNIEMIGRAMVGKNAAFLTGAEHSDVEKILEKNLRGILKIRPDPDREKELFQRSDNFPFAEKGVPAHTLMTSTDDDACYHKPCDDVKRIDLDHMIHIIRSVPAALSTIISGEDTPQRLRGY